MSDFHALALVGLILLAACHDSQSAAANALSQAATIEARVAVTAMKRELPPTPIDAILKPSDLAHVALADDGASVTLENGNVAHLTLDATLERAAETLLAQLKLPEAAIVMMDTRTFEVLVYASHVDHGPPRDLCAEAKAPSASVFKLVTASALVERANLGPETHQCYAGGGDQRIGRADLEEDSLRDKWCPSLATAMGKSTNTVFARLAAKHLDSDTLGKTARALGYGERVPFDLPNEPSVLLIGDDKLSFARSAAGFSQTTLSPLEAVILSATVARGGEALRPTLVRTVVAPSGMTIAGPRDVQPLRRAMQRETASALTTMMEHTITEGTSYRAFHDLSGRSFLPGMAIAGKTGTLNDPEGHRLYTWFTGFAPAHVQAGERQVAIAVLVVNQPKWRVKANLLAREMLTTWMRTAAPSDTVASRK